jgi:hypothetical protein
MRVSLSWVKNWINPTVWVSSIRVKRDRIASPTPYCLLLTVVLFAFTYVCKYSRIFIFLSFKKYLSSFNVFKTAREKCRMLGLGMTYVVCWLWILRCDVWYVITNLFLQGAPSVPPIFYHNKDKFVREFHCYRVNWRGVQSLSIF